jgi:hypothetical protein
MIIANRIVSCYVPDMIFRSNRWHDQLEDVAVTSAEILGCTLTIVDLIQKH